MDQISKGEVEFAGNKVKPGDAKSMEVLREAAPKLPSASARPNLPQLQQTRLVPRRGHLGVARSAERFNGRKRC